MIDSRIKLSDALDAMDEKTVNGRAHTFQVEWVARDGEKIRLDKAIKCGLRADVNRDRYIGLRSADNDTHVHTVDVHTITVFNGKRIYW